jgi:hypothetical protein
MMQSSMDFTVKPEDVTDELILKRCRSFRDALKLCRDCSPLVDKEILDEIDRRAARKMDKSHFSESLSGSHNRNFPPELVQILEDVCGNLVPTRYLALTRNFDLRIKRDALEIENDRLRSVIDRQSSEIEAVKKFLRESRIA